MKYNNKANKNILHKWEQYRHENTSITELNYDSLTWHTP